MTTMGREQNQIQRTLIFSFHVFVFVSGRRTIAVYFSDEYCIDDRGQGVGGGQALCTLEVVHGGQRGLWRPRHRRGWPSVVEAIFKRLRIVM